MFIFYTIINLTQKNKIKKSISEEEEEDIPKNNKKNARGKKQVNKKKNQLNNSNNSNNNNNNNSPARSDSLLDFDVYSFFLSLFILLINYFLFILFYLF